jgi:predicted Fe-Mo cluster-binding NifX family protein
MKIAVSATGPSLDSEIDPRFGRSEYFVIVELETMQFEILKNPNLGASSGAGISTAQLICRKGVGAVLTGRIGPKADQVFSAAGVRMLTGVSGRIPDAIERFKSGELLHGVDAGAGPEMRAGSAREPTMGMGGGRGMGRGMGCGGGRGMGMGARMTGADGGRPPRGWETEPWSERVQESGSQEDVAFLKQQAKALNEELRRIQRRIQEMDKQ